jgi:hypothetical protein
MDTSYDDARSDVSSSDEDEDSNRSLSSASFSSDSANGMGAAKYIFSLGISSLNVDSTIYELLELYNVVNHITYFI